MGNKLKNWLDDVDGTEPIEHWNTRRFYYEALERGVTDRRAIANAIALVDAANAFAKKNPNVSYSHLANLLLIGLHTDYYLLWGVARWFRLTQLFARQFWRRLRRRFR